MDHEEFMKAAIEEAKIARSEGNRPFGAVLVKDDRIVAKGHNTVLTSGDPTAHAELDLIKSYCAAQGHDLENHTIYVTCEPCPMCASALAWSNISTIVYGCDANEGPSNYPRQNELRCEDVIEQSGKNIDIVKHILREECKELFQ